MSYDAYILCTNPRSGSTMLCKYLAATGIAGQPQSYFHRPEITAWARALNLPADASMAAILTAARATATGAPPLFGLRLMRKSFAYLMQQLDPQQPDDTARLTAAFGRTAYLHLIRRDKVAQAVSLVRAEQSGLWHRAADGSELERSAPAQVLHYDPAAIAGYVTEFTARDAEWQHWFAQHAIAPLTIYYEDLAATPQQILPEILRHLGRDPRAADGLRPAVSQLSDATSRDWITRFRA